MSRPRLCQLCTDFGRSTEADVLATVPMCGKRPRYWLCLSCMDEIGAFVEEADLVEDVAT